MEKYDGFTIKNCWARVPWIVVGYFHQARSDVIKDFEKTMGEPWKKHRRRGSFKIVKVKLMEVE